MVILDKPDKYQYKIIIDKNAIFIIEKAVLNILN